MKVAHILRKYDPRQWGGTESAILELCNGMSKRGIESVVYAPSTGPFPPELDRIGLDGHGVRRFKAFVPIAFASKPDRLRMIAVGGNIMSWDAPLKLLREPGLDIIHAHALHRLGGVARTVARRRRLPLVVTIHGGYFDLPDEVRARLLQPARRGLDYGKIFGLLVGARRVLDDADAIVTCNPREAELLQQPFGTKRIVCMPHAVPFAEFEVDHRHTAKSVYPDLAGRRVLLVVGRIDPVKNQLFVIEAMPQIRKRHEDAVLVLAGASDDDEYDRLLRLRIRELELEGTVLMTGGIPPRDPRLIGLYQIADLVVLPSLSETFGLVILEAWAAGTPVLTTSTSGAKHILDHAESGCLFDLASPAQYCDLVDRALSRSREATRVAEDERARARSKFDTEVVAARYRLLYEELIRGERP